MTAQGTAAVLLALALVSTAPAGPGAALSMASPITVADRPAPVRTTPISLDAEAYPGLKQSRHMVWEGFPLDATRRVDLALERFEVLTEDAVIVSGSLQGDTPMPRPDVVLLRGEIVGQPGSRVFLSLSPYGTNGFIDGAGGPYVISSGPYMEERGPVIYDAAALPADAINLRPFSCATEDPGAPPALGAGGAAGGDPCGGAEIAVETNWEYTDEIFGGDTAASSAYVVTLFGAVSEIYNRDVASPLQVGFVRVWPNENDLWAEGTVSSLLNQFQDYWNENMDSVQRHLAHFLAPTVLPGAAGVAFLDGLCDNTDGYGVSGYINGFFPYPLEDHNDQNWDVVVVSHEVGHNFGARHTHDINPPVDQCAFGLCENADQGTIMSYCHTCPGGIANLLLRFHDRIINEEILPFLDSVTCDLTFFGPQIIQQPASATVCQAEDVTFSVVVTGAATVTYQWRKDGVDIPGAVGPIYTIVAATSDDNGVYDVVISGDCGNITSLPATLLVEDCIACPEIDSQPGSLLVCEGDPAVFSVTASGSGPLSYQWRKDGTPISGATNASYTIASVTPGDEGLYDVVVSNDCGSATSDAASLMVDDCSCPYDLNGDGLVGVYELLGVLGDWGQPISEFDLDGGGVGISDVLLLLSNWGLCP